ncbi:MAG TPA: S9 family peptidase [Candidatus Acidoferrum sp.]
MFNLMSGKKIQFVTAMLAMTFAMPVAVCAQQAAAQGSAAASAAGALTVDRIYSQPSLSGRLSRGIAWSPDGKTLTFFEPNGTGRDAKNDLVAIDAASGKRSVLVSADKLETALPKEEGKSSQATGLGRRAPSQYQWAPSGEALLLESSTALVWFDLKTETPHTLVSGKAGLADAKISPDGKYVSFIREHNLWLVSTADGKERAFTNAGTEEVRKGELDWVYPEELDISTAYWWSPDSASIAYFEMNEGKVTQFSMLDFDSFTGEADLQRYPVPGGSNPVVRVLVASIAGGEARVMDTGADTNIYIPRVNWLPDSKHVAIQRLNREQTVLDLLLADVATGKSSTLLTEKDQYWINVSDDLHFFKNSSRFLWSSERTGYRHLYLYDLSGKQLAQITDGKWEVTGVDSVDEGKSLVYFTATEKSPMERQLYRVSFDGSGFSRVTKEDGTHAIQFSPNATLYTDTYSNAMNPPRQDLYHADGSKSAIVNENNQSAQLAAFHLSPVEFFAIQSHDGVSLNCWMIKPPNFDPSKKYPVIVYTYGGPHAQVVVNAWTGSTFLWHQMMAQKGYIIFALDNRGSAGRGHLFEEPIHFRLGAQELSDQRDGAAWLQHQAFVDPNRIGIWGWSYGGHMTLHAVFEAPEIFKVGFAGGPVTDWHFYDTIYTERYLGLLPQREESYQESSPIKNAEKLKGKLLIAHGTGDDNVHFSNTLALINDLIKAGKYPEVMPFPGRGHGVSDPPARRMLMNRATQFFLDNL